MSIKCKEHLSNDKALKTGGYIFYDLQELDQFLTALE